MKRRLQRVAATALLIGGAIAGLLAVALFVLSFAAPSLAESLGFGRDYLLRDIGSQGVAVSEALRLRPGLDLALLVGSYAVVCLILYGQQSVQTYLKHRRNFG